MPAWPKFPICRGQIKILSGKTQEINFLLAKIAISLYIGQS
jgi:hypothetical protein